LDTIQITGDSGSAQEPCPILANATTDYNSWPIRTNAKMAVAQNIYLLAELLFYGECTKGLHGQGVYHLHRSPESRQLMEPSHHGRLCVASSGTSCMSGTKAPSNSSTSGTQLSYAKSEIPGKTSNRPLRSCHHQHSGRPGLL
jgi:hypothetical protein